MLFVYLGSCQEIERQKMMWNWEWMWLTEWNGTLIKLGKNKHIHIQEARVAVHNGFLVPTIMYESQFCIMRNIDECKLIALQMRSLRNICVTVLHNRQWHSEPCEGPVSKFLWGNFLANKQKQKCQCSLFRAIRFWVMRKKGYVVKY